MRNKPLPETQEYFDYIEKIIPIIESKLPVNIYAITGYQFAFYWVDLDGEDYPDPNNASIEIFERLIGKRL